MSLLRQFCSCKSISGCLALVSDLPVAGLTAIRIRLMSHLDGDVLILHTADVMRTIVF